MVLRWWRRNRTRIVYRSEYLTGLHASNSHRTFDVKRFKKVRDALVREGLVSRRAFLKAEKVSTEDLRRVHSAAYLESLRNPLVVGQALALDYINPWDNYVLEYFQYVTGGTILAARVALERNLPVFNLGGGYHHAHPDRAEGFCLINDVCVAIEKMRAEKGIEKVLVIDLDYHQGNGTLLFYEDDPDVFTFSIHSEHWVEVQKANNIDIDLPAHTGDEVYLGVLAEQLPAIFRRFQPELVIY
ncbi:histone deacetylase, partial [Candidatus Parcubacteria bacterium]